jgi:hypothetical protein
MDNIVELQSWNALYYLDKYFTIQSGRIKFGKMSSFFLVNVPG